jgi:heat shock protein 4
MSVVGLDFGNQNSVIAAAGRGGVDVILNGNSNRLNDTMVSFKESRFMGENAKIIASSNFKNTIKNMKRLIGLSFDDERAQAEMKRVPFTCVPMKHASGPASIGVKVQFNDEEMEVPVEAVAGMLIRHMGEIVANKSAENSNADIKDLFPADWVISIPGYYTDSQRRALLAGCKMVGIDIQRLMHEHTATALAYGIFKDIRKEFTKDKPTNVMFLDLGQTSYTCSIVSFEPGKLIVKSAHYDEDLGGRDFDLKIAEWISAKFEEKYSGKLSGKPMERPNTLLKLLDAAEKAKKTLSPTGVKEVRINVEMLMDDYDFQVTLTAAEYEEMCAPLLARLNPPIQRAFAETGLTPKDISSFVIVGGGSRVGCVKITLAKILGTDLNATNNGLSTTMNADEAVARGTALQSAILSPRFKVLPYEIIESQPYPVKISWEGDAAPAEGEEEPTNSVIMFDRGSNFNSVRRVTLRRSGEFVVQASYDESADKYNFPAGLDKNICAFKIKSPEGPSNKVRVNVKQDIHGTILLSSAQMIEEVDEEPAPAEESKDTEMKEGEEGEKAEKKKKIKKTNLEFTELRSLEWTKAEMDSFFEKEVAMKNVDRIVKETSDMRNKLESYVYDMRDKIMSESHLAPYATDEEKSSFNDLLEKAENWLYEDGFDANKSAFSDKLSSLQKVGNPIERRQSEAEARPNAMAALQRSVEKYQSWTNTSQGNEEYAHISEEEFNKCKEICDSTASWMYETMDKQGSLPLSQDPIVTVAEINSKTQELTKIISPIMHKPKPKPKPEEKQEEEKPAEESKEETPESMETEDAPATEETKTEPMDTTA